VKQLRRIRLIFSWPGTRLLVRIIILNAIAKTSFFFVTRTTFDLLHVWNCIEAVCYVIKCYILWRVRTWITCVISEARESKKSKGINVEYYDKLRTRSCRWLMMESYNDTSRPYSAYLLCFMYWLWSFMGRQDKAHFTFLLSDPIAPSNLAVFRRVTVMYSDFLSAVM